VTDVTVVLTPPTDQYVQFHNQQVPHLPYVAIRTAVAAACARNGLAFIDGGSRPRPTPGLPTRTT
jgi:hypothetical protein